MLKQIFGGRILTPSGWLTGGSVIVEGSKIFAVETTELPIVDAERINVRGADIVPGGIDLHVHGGGGRDFMEGTREAFEVAAQAHLQYGTTSIFPTLSSSTVPMINAAIDTCREMMADKNTTIQGLHLEGPYFNPAQAGAQIPEWIKLPNPEEYFPILQRGKGVLKRWDEAPELEGSIGFIRACRVHDVLPSIGHTRAEYFQVHAANQVGMSHATHFYNAMPVVFKNREFKIPGTVESIFAEQTMTVEMIADGIHVPPMILRMAWQVKGTEQTCLITDSLACACSEGDVAFDPRVIVEDGVCKLADRSALAGSIATMDRLVRTVVQQAEIPMEDACRMISETPAKIMGIYDSKGSIQKGKDADIICFDRDQQLTFVMQAGQIVRWNKPADSSMYLY
ncbi:MAG: N-acetylglucosamine-6-phosphate deacetylase [Paludibacteraceae bacterium]|nr:N-acetylglucosamine-6-phosphate deacetylase [Paludibacteraceae bacterium]